ncbi:MAG TPA: class E sortase [Actinocrinis sp.]|uniref:sortase n=1 Tax=Actinocrinis sp. TaxID=1920516 RepID=UPI002D2AE9B3|nr:class E sortase [Actinocrinis sp.]HZU56336.1 class E sortase [Actinocrinis sp.]
MSLTLESAEAAAPEPEPGAPAAEQPPEAEPDTQSHASVWMLGAALTVLGALLLGFVADVWVIGSLRHSRDQQVQYAAFRYALANASAPVGPLDVNGHVVGIGTPVALLDIPELGLRQVVAEGTSSATLMSGPGHLPGTVLPGQAGISVIMARRLLFGGPFHYLDQLRPKDTFTVTTGQGVSTYRVLDVRHADDPLPPTPAANQGRLTLMTADGNAFVPSDILRVDAELISKVQPTPARLFDANPPNEDALAGEPAAWMPLVLWAQALVLAAIGLTWARLRWGVRQAWLVGLPTLAALGLAVADQIARLLPNLL